MSETRQYIAIDLGAESGRAMLGTLTGHTLELQEIHRFPNGPIEVDDTLRWDFPSLMREIKTGIAKCARAATAEIAGIGVDSWGVDFGLLDEKGQLIELPYNYRDARTDGMMEKAFERMPKRTIFEHTGIQFMQFNSLYQFLAMALKDDPALKRAAKCAFIADLVSYELSGELFAEYTLASTTQMLNMRTGQWALPVLEALGIPDNVLPPVVRPATVVGALREDLAAELGCGRLPLIAIASHDTGSAVAAVPAEEGSWAYLSSGTWSLMGAETPEPVITDATFDELTNEGGVDGSIRLLKNIMGLWLVQECRRQWQREGDDLSYADLTDMARAAKPFAARVNVLHDGFLAPGEMPRRINEHLAATGQAPLEDRGAMIRAVLEGLAFAYRHTLTQLEEVVGKRIDVLHIVGGGTQNELLNQFAANATNRRVVAGPIEATSIGNILLQARATGQLADLPELRQVVRESFPIRTYVPQEPEAWAAEYAARTSD